ncbi:MAG: hypothetical protein C0605_01115 [Hyphomicrobiales bacterium]|nr:MAG: hypothetical protein C0605_01115 [Hyphomicrobiales bacterium]
MVQDSSSKPADKPETETGEEDQSDKKQVELTETQKKLSEAPGRAQIKPPPLKQGEAQSDDDGVIHIDRKVGRDEPRPEPKIEADGPYSPANQNLPNASGLMRDLRKRPPMTAYLMAFVLSIIWLALGIAYVWGYYGPKLIEAESFSVLFNTPSAITLIAAFVLPVPAVWLMAMMIRRSQELRLMSHAMARASIQLTMPEGFASEAISSIGQSIRREVAAMNEGVERALGRASELEALVHSEITALEQAYADSENRVKTMLESLQAERRSISSAGQTLGHEIEPTIDRLREESSNLHTLVEGAAKNLNALDKRLTQHANGLHEAAELVSEKTAGTLNHMTAQANEMKSLAGGVLKEIKETASQFNDQAEGLNSAAQALKTANLDIDEVLKQRHDKLSGLAELLMRKSEDIDALMRTYSTIVDDALTGAENRAREVGKNLAQNAAHSAKAAIGELEKMRQEANKETARSINDFQKNYEHVSRDLSGNLEQAGQRFAATTQDLHKTVRSLASNLEETRTGLRSAVRDMAAELEKSRHELNASVMNLPEETRKNAAALRQAVADEIGALETLNEIVRGKGMLDDTFEPSEPSRNSAPRIKSLASLQVGSSSPPKPGRDGRSAGIARKISSAIAGEAPPQRSSKWSLPDLLAAASTTEDQPGRFKPPQKRQEDDFSDSFNDVSAREVAGAQDSEPPEPARAPRLPGTGGGQTTTTPGTLNSLSVDLSRALDHHAPAELWHRYRSGEPNVFNRKIYTLRGQRIFDEIAHKYQHEPPFRQDVDNYIHDFENLLESASDSDREDMLVETYLTSETGKVYLMLAHASGRIGDD